MSSTHTYDINASFCNINLFTVTLYKFNAHVLNKSINLYIFKINIHFSFFVLPKLICSIYNDSL